MWSLMTDVCRAMGVRTDVPFRELTDKEKDIVLTVRQRKAHLLQGKSTPRRASWTLPTLTPSTPLRTPSPKSRDEKGMKRVEKFLRVDTCPDCGGSRLSEAARAPKLRGIGLDEACKMTLTALCDWVDGVPASLPPEMRPMAESICESFRVGAKRLMDLGLGYLTLDRASATLSTGERQRMQLARAVRNRTTGVLYVLDEPSIGLHPSNIVGLNGVMHDLIADGNSVVLVDHDTQVLAESDYIIEMGPRGRCRRRAYHCPGHRARADCQRRVTDRAVLGGQGSVTPQNRPAEELFAEGRIHLSTGHPHGQTAGSRYPERPPDRRDRRVRVGQDNVDFGKPCPGAGGQNQRRGPACPRQRRAGRGYRAGETHRCNAYRHQRPLHRGDLRQCPRRAAQGLCPHAGRQAAGVQGGRFLLQHGQTALPGLRRHRHHQPGRAVLPDVEIPCTACRGSRYAPEADAVHHENKHGGAYTLPELMDMDINTALTACTDLKLVTQRLKSAARLGPWLP